ncbi:TPA: DUF1642 domain-containing protein [Streptococcus suis]|nr:DUF1642 domain-containing protein [Streptococcus suis]
MNKQEAIEIIEQSKIKITNRERVIFKAGEIIGESVQVDYVPLEVVVNTIDQINKPQKVVIPKYIADKIEYCKDTEGYGLFHAMDYCYQYKDSAEWLEDNQETFARAWLDGYEIEQEKLYTVEIPDPNRKGTNRIYLGKSDPNSKVFIHKGNFNPKKNKNLWLTEEEIKKDFAWAWQFAKEVE